MAEANSKRCGDKNNFVHGKNSKVDLKSNPAGVSFKNNQSDTAENSEGIYSYVYAEQFDILSVL